MRTFSQIVVSADIAQAAQEVIRFAIREQITTKEQLIKIKNTVCQKHRLNSFRDAELIVALDTLIQSGEVAQTQDLVSLRRLLIKRRVRTLSGIAPISVLTKPWACRGRCTYCPTEVMHGGKTLMEIDLEKKGQQTHMPAHYHEGDLVMPKSYISSEPGAMRALQADFDPWLQITRRLKALHKIGHKPEKCELIIQGGTFSDLPVEYRLSFVIRCYQAFNDPFGEQPEWTEGDATKLHTILDDVQVINESAQHRVIGLTCETRPDALPPAEINLFRELGVTRVEMGVQTLDEKVNEMTKRGHDVPCVREATHKLRAAGFKIVYHMMPMLPGSTPEIDLQSWHGIWNDKDFRPDYVKIYPTSVVPFSELHDIHARGEYEPYDHKTLFELLVKHVETTPPWVRISRLIRDIPSTAIVAGSRITNLRQLIEIEMAKCGSRSMDIRAREIKADEFDLTQAQLKVHQYQANHGAEHFLEFQLADQTLLALLRLHLPQDDVYTYDDHIKGCAMIRELHTYGVLQSLHSPPDKDELKGVKNNDQQNPPSSSCRGGNSAPQNPKAQHIGLGRQLIAKAEQIARDNGFAKLAVISGVGVKEYYRTLGFIDAGTYLVKEV